MDPTKIWAVLISWGTMFPDVTTKTYKVRCVNGAAEPMADYTDNMDGTVTDNVTGLMWEQKTDDGGPRDKDNTYTWKDALAYCESLLLGEHSDWRMPTPKELERIVDLTKSSPAIDTEIFLILTQESIGQVQRAVDAISTKLLPWILTMAACLLAKNELKMATRFLNLHSMSTCMCVR